MSSWKLAVAVLVVGASVASANLLSNASFETGTGQGGGLGGATVDSWTFWGGGWWANDAGAVYDGTYAIKRWDDGTGMYQDFTASAATEYAFSLWAYDGSAEPLVDRRVDLKVEWYDALDAKIGSTITIDSYGEGLLNTWTNLSGNQTAPGSTAKGRFLITTEADGASPGGSLYYDMGSVDTTAIPEPTIAALVLLGLAGIRLIRKRA